MRALYLLLAIPAPTPACEPDSGPGFGAGGSRYEEPEDTASTALRDIEGPDDFLDHQALSSCMERGEVEVETGEAPPEIEGEYQVQGEATASDSWPVGTSINSTMCLYEQSDEGSIGLTENASWGEYVATQAWIRGEDDRFTIYMELLGEDLHGGSCVVQSLAVLTGELDSEGDFTMRTASVPVGLDGCDDWYQDEIGGCWATADTATLLGDCEG